MLRLLLPLPAFALALSACAPPGLCNVGAAERSAGAAPARIAVFPTPPDLFLAGEEAQVTFTGNEEVGDDCKPLKTFREARVEVRDPANELIASTVDATENASGQVTALVKFNAARPGWYHVTAVMDFGSRTPVLQSEVLVTVNKLAAAKVDLDAACTALVRTAAGTLICDHQVFRAGALVQSLSSGAQVAVAGNAVWVLSGGSLSRYEDPGSGPLAQSPASSASIPFSPFYRLLARETEAVVVSQDAISRYRVEASALTATTLNGRVSDAFTTNPGNRLQAVWTDSTVHVLSPAVNTVSGAGLVACRYQLGAAAITKAESTCPGIAGASVGTDGAGFFVAEGQLLRYLLPGASGTLEVKARGTIASGYAFAYGSAAHTPLAGVSVSEDAKVGIQTPSERNPWTLPKVSGGDILFEQYENTVSYELLGASGALAWERTRSVPVKTRIFER